MWCSSWIYCSKNSEFIDTCLKFALARLSPPTLALIAANHALIQEAI